MVRSSLIVRRWTPDDDELLMRLLEEGNSVKAIAAHLKRTMSAVETRGRLLRARAALRTERAKSAR